MRSEWPSADEVARVGGAVRPLPDGGAEGNHDADGGHDFPGDITDLPRALRQRIAVNLATDEPIGAYLVSAWKRHHGRPAVDSLADAARVECGRREAEVDTVTLTPEVVLPRATWKRIWYRYLDRVDRVGADERLDLGDTIHEFTEFAPTLVVRAPDDPETSECDELVVPVRDDPATSERDELVVHMNEWPVVPRRRDGEPLDPDLDGRPRGERR